MALFYPAVGFHFSVAFIINSKPFEMGFQSVSGLSVEYDVETYQEGGENRFEHKLPGRTKYSDLVLKRGYSVVPTPVSAWCQKAFRDREFEPANLLVSLLNELHLPLKSWNVVQAWPRKWALSDFNASESAIMIDTLELSYRYFEVLPPEPPGIPLPSLG